jgi:hypothetical protein
MIVNNHKNKTADALKKQLPFFIAALIAKQQIDEINQ